MTNEEFQKIVLSELRDLKGGQARLEKRQSNLEAGMARLEERHSNLEAGMVRLEERQSNLETGLTRLEERHAAFDKKLNIVYDQTVDISEGYTINKSKLDQINSKLDNLSEDFKTVYAILGEHEVAIRTLRRKDFERTKEYYEAKIREETAKIRESLSPED